MIKWKRQVSKGGQRVEMEWKRMIKGIKRVRKGLKNYMIGAICSHKHIFKQDKDK